MSLPADLLLGIYLGALTGVFPALVAWTLGFTFRYFTGVTIPGTVVMVFAVALAGVQGGLLGLLDPSLASSPATVVALLLVMMGSLYAHAKGDEMGAEFPRRLSLKRLRERTLSADVVEQVGGFGQVRVQPAGPVADVEGYPPLPESVRAELAAGEWTFPADLPLSEIENRLANRLATTHDLSEVAVDLDSHGRATISAAPATGALSRRVPAGTRAVSTEVLLPTGLARGDEVALSYDGGWVAGPVLSARTHGISEEGDADPEVESSPRAPTSTGGEGRLTVALPRAEARTLLSAADPKVAVQAQGTRREVELVSLLRKAGRGVRKVTVRADWALAGTSLGGLDALAEHGVSVLALRHDGDERDAPVGWQVAPPGSTRVHAGDQLFVAGSPDALARFEEGVA